MTAPPLVVVDAGSLATAVTLSAEEPVTPALAAQRAGAGMLVLEAHEVASEQPTSGRSSHRASGRGSSRNPGRMPPGLAGRTV